MAEWPAHGVTPWDDALKAYIDDSVDDATIPDATTSVKGKAKFATPEQAAAGVATDLIVNPAGVAAAVGQQVPGVVATYSLAESFGLQDGQVISPWRPSPVIGAEWWQTGKMISGGGNNTSLTPSLTGDSTNKTSKTRIDLGNHQNRDLSYRLEFDYDLTGINGWADIAVLLTDTGGNALSGTIMQRLLTGGSPKKTGHYIFDFKPTTGDAQVIFELRLDVYNNSSAGVVAVTNVSLKNTGDVSRPMLVSKQYSTGNWPFVYWQQRDAKTDKWKVASMEFGSEGDMAFSYGYATGFGDDAPWRMDPADSAFLRATVNVDEAVNDQQEVTSTRRLLRFANNDQIIEVWNGSAWELRGNVHSGEFSRSPGTTWKIDRGAGFVAYTPVNGLEPIRRFQCSMPTEMRRSVDGTTPFANVDHLFTLFPDGVVRCDRTTMFLVDTQVRNVFEWMSTHNETGGPYIPFLGRIGKGLDPTGEVDNHVKVPTPGTVTATPAGTGGTLPAGDYSYRVAAVSPYGETLTSAAATATTTGSTSKVTLTWADVTYATGYVIYGRKDGVERVIARVATATWVDDGSAVPTTTPPVTVSGARVYPGSLAYDAEHSTDASWAVWLEPINGWCIGSIYDRDAVLARPQVDKVRTRLESGPGIVKAYTNIYWAGGVDSVTIPAGTVWTATHYSQVYLPFDAAQYHHEIALRAANLPSLRALYPTT